MKKSQRSRRPNLRPRPWNAVSLRNFRGLGLLDRTLRLEPLEQRCLLTLDFGDAPLPYPTLLSENGARHEVTGPMLGATRNGEPDGTHSANATADGLDEYGVSFGTIQVGALGAAVTVNVQGGAAKLDAWIDFNGDGSWGGLGEQIFDNVAVAEGNNALSFDVPSWAPNGVTFARFRLSTAGDLGIGGLASDGEVEDYAVMIVSPTATSGVFSSQNLISGASDGAISVFAADVDGDGDMDVVSASLLDDTIAWHENDGSQNFTPHTISITADGAISVFAADLDGDGDIDVVSASTSDDKIAWYENDGSQNFTSHTISTTADGASRIFVADVDDDGDLDILSASEFDDKIAWYKNDGSQNFTSHTITTAADRARGVFAADVDGDGDMDVLSASYFDDKVIWYENDGSQNFSAHTISTAADGPQSVFAADVDGDGDMDVLSASINDDKTIWYENDGSQNFTSHTISTAADGPLTVFAADLDGDGDTDVVSASYADDKVAWYENDGSQNFTSRTISTSADGAWAALAADIDSDGDLDILSASRFDDRVAWYENLNSDFGDAPAFYPTLLSEDGARHEPLGPTLGATRDGELDGTHSANASADGADEDGVSVGAIQVGELGATLTVNVQGGAGKLDAWIDFNGDGSWGGPGEQIADSLAVAVGNNVLSFDVPSWAVDGVTFTRFRLSTAGDLGIGGLAADGEVEDYSVTITSPADASGVFGVQNVISASADGAFSVYAADVDGDGDMDVLSASLTDDKIAWYENDGTNTFISHTISTTADSAFNVFAADVDGDGDMDVLSASAGDNKIAWYENDGSETFTIHVISNAAIQASSVFAADLDKDGDIDVLSASFDDDKIAWYENDGSQNFTPHTITTSAYAATSVFAADVDADGDMDVLSASAGDNKIAWYENDGSQNFTTHTISAAANGARSVFAADVDGDGDTDVLSASANDNKIAWYENDGSQSFSAHTITTSADTAISVFAADVEGDGDIDVLSASSNDNKIAWYENDGSQNFTPHTITTSAYAARSVFAADVDGDGDLDALSASYNLGEIAWYENTPTTPPTVDLNGEALGVDFDAIWSQSDPVFIADVTAATAGDDSGNLASLTATLSGWVHAGELLAADTTGTNITASFNGTSLLLTGVDSVANYQQVLRTVTYDRSYAPGIKLGIVGDSLSDEYFEQDYGAYSQNWIEQLVQYAGIDIGPTAAAAGQPGGTWGEPRRTGYQYDWARYADDSTEMLAHGQHTGLAAQVGVDEIGYSVLMIGANDFFPGGPGSAYDNIYNGLWSVAQIDAYVAQSLANVTTAVDTLRATGVPLVLANFPDYGVTPFTSYIGYVNAGQRQLVSEVVEELNSQLEILAITNEIVYVDLNGITRAIFGTNASPNATLTIGGIAISLTGPASVDSGTNPTGGFVADGIHPNTTLQGVIANLVTTALNIGYQANLPVFSEQQVLAHKGIAYGGSDTLEGQIGSYSDYVHSYAPSTRAVTFIATDLSSAVSGVAVATITIQPSVAISPATVAHLEGNGGTTEYVFTVVLSAATGQTVTVAYDADDGTATLADNDYQVAGGVLTFVAGETVKQITVLVTGDTTNEADEDFSVTLSGAVNATLTTASATGTIQNDDLPPATIAGRHLFYNQSGTVTRYDGNNLAINASDDNSIATDKTAYLWEAAGAATFANVSSYTKGINGIMVDISGSHPSITADDFIFRVGNNNSPGLWGTANAPSSVSVRAGAGVSGSDRVEIIWAPGTAPTKQWLQVITLANADTGLAQAVGYPAGHGDAFFFGNAPGNSGLGDTALNANVNSTDELGARNNPANLAANIPITNIYDYDRNAQVNANDQLVSRNNATNPTTVLKYLNLTTAPAAPEADGGGEISPLVATDSGVASGLTATVTTNGEIRVPKWISNRIDSIELNTGHAARLFQYLHYTNSPHSRALLQKFDHVADALVLDDDLLESLIDDLGLE